MVDWLKIDASFSPIDLAIDDRSGPSCRLPVSCANHFSRSLSSSLAHSLTHSPLVTTQTPGLESMNERTVECCDNCCVIYSTWLLKALADRVQVTNLKRFLHECATSEA